MRKVKSVLSVFFSCALLFASTACSLNRHTHEWTNYIVKQPTCTEKGLLEKLCEDCGDKKYEDLAPIGHTYQGGSCTVCGSIGYSEYEAEPIPMPEGANNVAMISWEKLYNIKQTIYPEDNISFETFISLLSCGQLTNLYIDNLGLFHATAQFLNDSQQKKFELPIIWSVGKVSPTNQKESKFGNVSSVKVQIDQLIVTYSDGVQTDVGTLKNSPITITGFGLNPNNEIVVYYSNNTIAFVGKISEGKATETQADFIYQPISGGYAVVQALNYNESKIFKIPVSHQGKPIISIADNAFAKIASTAISIVVPDTVTTFALNAFSGLSSNTSIYFEESLANCTINDRIFLIEARCYFKGDWSYVNGIPTPNK